MDSGSIYLVFADVTFSPWQPIRKGSLTTTVTWRQWRLGSDWPYLSFVFECFRSFRGFTRLSTALCPKCPTSSSCRLPNLTGDVCFRVCIPGTFIKDSRHNAWIGKRWSRMQYRSAVVGRFRALPEKLANLTWPVSCQFGEMVYLLGKSPSFGIPLTERDTTVIRLCVDRKNFVQWHRILVVQSTGGMKYWWYRVLVVYSTGGI